MSGTMPIHPGDEERFANEMTRDLEILAGESVIRPMAGFVDRVMAAVAGEPLPQPAHAFGVALLAGRFRAALAAVGDARRVVVAGSTPIAVRAQALALVLVVAIGSAAIAGGAAVGAMGLFSGNPSTTPLPTNGLSSSPRLSSSPSPSPSSELSPDASPTSEASESPKPTGTPVSTQRPRAATPSPTGTDDHSGGSGSGGGDQTPDPTDTPSPTETDDGGGGDG